VKPIPIDDYNRFKREVGALKKTCYLEFFSENPEVFQIKKEKTISKNLERIFSAVLKISNKKGFHAMTMRDLSKAACLSTGALYNYFSGKEELLEMMNRHRRTIASRVLKSNIAVSKEPLRKLRAAIKTHLYLSEAMQPWFFFSYMEAKNIGPKERRAAVQDELNTEKLFTDIILMGRDQGNFVTEDCQMTAGLIKAMLQDWYLKRAKYARRNVEVDVYARFMTAFIESSLVNPEPATRRKR
jgi:TetR/AcrR family transcriptional regulator, cholesterol catabolism regulator